MILKQFYLNCLAHASYLIGDEHTHAAAVVDPQRDVDQYLAFAAGHAPALRVAKAFAPHWRYVRRHARRFVRRCGSVARRHAT